MLFILRPPMQLEHLWDKIQIKVVLPKQINKSPAITH